MRLSSFDLLVKVDDREIFRKNEAVYQTTVTLASGDSDREKRECDLDLALRLSWLSSV
jgi:hypothetical protein